MQRKCYLLTVVSLPNQIKIEGAYLYSDTVFVTLKRGQYLVPSSGKNWQEAFLRIKAMLVQLYLVAKLYSYATFGKSKVAP